MTRCNLAAVLMVRTTALLTCAIEKCEYRNIVVANDVGSTRGLQV